jgi:hypothetical protein
LILFSFLPALPALTADFSSQWQGTRVWVGPEYWANPLQDWRLDNGEAVASAAQNRTLHLLTHQLGRKPGGFTLEVKTRLDAERAPSQPDKVWAGFAFALRGALDDYRYALVHSTSGFSAGLRADGRVFVEDVVGDETLTAGQEVTLKLRVEPRGEHSLAVLEAGRGGRAVTVQKELRSADLHGNVALAVAAPRPQPREPNQPELRWRFRDWRVAGDKVEAHPEQTFGPILWTQYTLSRGILKLTAQMPPLGKGDAPEARLEVRRAGAWKNIAQARIDPLSRTATFRVASWNDRGDTPYRVAYRWQGRDHFWSGAVRRDPADKPVLSIGVFSCDNGYLFPLSRLVRNVGIQNPDLLFFAGDQIYEGYGGFGVARQADVETAMLDYLRKYWQFGWSWRELLKDRPSVIIPDDHDVFQGNLWGHGGRKAPGGNVADGGYIMPPAWVNAVQRTQASHLPDPVDGRPVEQGISVYFTDMLCGGLSFAILEDRKWKSGPGDVLPPGRRNAADPKRLDVPGAQLLGERQEAFLKKWAADGEGKAKVVLSQTIFCKVTTHAGAGLKPHAIDLDSNAWPQTARNRALELLRPASPVMIHGDQHLGALVHHGIANWEDGPVAFMVPGTANGFPRAWWPDKPGENHQPGAPEWTGRYLDGLGNRITVLAAGNPQKGSNELAGKTTDPERLGHLKGSGHGIVKFDREKRAVTFEMWRYVFDAAKPKPGDQFEGFPRTLPLDAVRR